jgi:hypothetical protein
MIFLEWSRERASDSFLYFAGKNLTIIGSIDLLRKK